jgi:hypothetical protein
MSMIGFILGYDSTHDLAYVSSKSFAIDSEIDIARTSCWTLIREVLFMLTSTACLKR